MERGVWLVSLQSLYKLPSIHALRYPAGTIFDPLCFLAFLVRTAKEILQDLCRIKSGWDDEIPDEYSLRWESWLADLLKLSILTVSRCLKPADFGQVKSSQLHRFSDASEAAFGWASFLRLINNIGKVDCSFQIGIASCALESRFDSMLRTLSRDRFCTPGKDVQERVICATDVDSFFRTDSMSVLCYVKNESTHFHTFVANLIAMVRDGSNPHQLRHVEGAAILGDYASRGTTAKALMTCQSWLMGLEFLWKPEGD